ncbi:intracellular protein transport protein USO1-like [Aristolochia californica]|uniref:intracellular protein transport protein USO1-like n=1 Tax=Aristolochia californica TaxID=171875 RepID=UPI0035D9C885
MTADTKECVALSGSSALEFEAKSGLNSCEDLSNAGGFNGIPCRRADDNNGEAKDDTEASYVFVNGDSDNGGKRDLDTDPIALTQPQSNVDPLENCLESRATAAESLVSGQVGQIHVEASNAEAERVEKDVVVEEMKDLNSSEENQDSQFNVSHVVTLGTLSAVASLVEVSGEDQQPGLEVTPAELVSGALDVKLSQSANSSLGDLRSENESDNFADKNSEKKNGTLVEKRSEKEFTDVVDPKCSEKEAIIGSGEGEELMTVNAALLGSNGLANKNESSRCDGRRELVPVCVEPKILGTEAADGSTESEKLVVNELKIEESTERAELIVNELNNEESTERGELIVNELNNGESTERWELIVNELNKEANEETTLRGEFVVNVQDTEATDASAERGEPESNDKDAGATDGSTDKGEVVVNQDTEATEASSERRELVVNDMDTETTDGSAEKDELVMNDSPMLETKIINTSSELELVTDAIDDAKLDSEVSYSADIRELITADTSSETKNTIDSLESVETVVDVNKSGSVTSEAQIGNANTNCSVKSGELTSLDATIFKCETSDASIMEALQTNTGKVFVEEERLASAVRSDSVEIEEIRSSSVEDVKPEAEPENDFGKSGQNISTSLQKDVTTEGEVSLHCCENKSNLSVNPGDSLESEVEFGSLCFEFESKDEVENGESLLVCSINEVKSGVELTNRYIEKTESVSMQASGEIELSSVERNQCLPAVPVDGFGSEAKFQKDSVESSEYKPLALVDDVKVESDSTATSVIENEDSLINRNGDEKLISEDVGGLQEVHPASQEDSTAASLDAQKAEMEAIKRGPSYIIRVPRFVNDELRAKINQAQLEVNQKTQERDSIRVALQKKKATCAEYWDNVLAARSEERAARNAVNAKFREMDSVHLIINRMKNATSIDEIDERIHGMEHKIQHETMHLKEEKQLIREIKQLKQAREQLCASMGTQVEVQEAFDQRDNIEERIKALRQELDSLKSELSHAERTSIAAKKKHSDECEVLKNLQVQFKYADSLRQQAYAEFQSLKKQMYEKSKYFHMYKGDQKAAADFASAGDRENLWHFCNDQVEKFMELWNKNDEFRTEYVKHNTLSTVRRFRTLDGRSLAPDEEPPVVWRSSTEEKSEVSTNPASMKINTAETVLEVPGAPVTPEKTESKMAVDSVPKKLSTKPKKTSKSNSTEIGSATVSGRSVESEEFEKVIEKEKKLSTEEEESASKEEELRREEAAAKLKEQWRLEEIAKAKEAEERKRRNAERAKARAELREQKEAELKEKEREKRARRKEKKEKKRGVQVDGSSGNASEDTSQVLSENAPAEPDQEPEIKEKPATVVRRYSKSMAAVKTKSVPPLPLRNRGKRRMQPWMWWALFAVALIVVFLAVNSTFSSKFSRSNIGF